ISPRRHKRGGGEDAASIGARPTQQRLPVTAGHKAHISQEGHYTSGLFAENNIKISILFICPPVRTLSFPAKHDVNGRD
ncbi:hypothetical protein CHU92_02630, partial [Flavobacterium cyanobacteriorum]